MGDFLSFIAADLIVLVAGIACVGLGFGVIGVRAIAARWGKKR